MLHSRKIQFGDLDSCNGEMIMENKENENIFYESVRTLVLEMEQLSGLAVEQNTPLVDMVLDGHITNEDEVVHIMDRLLDWCQFDEGLQLFKKCVEVYIISIPCW